VPENRKVDLTAGVVTNFRSRDGATLAIDTAISKSAMVLLLAAWPGAIPFEELLAAAAAHLPTSADTPPDTAGLAEQLAADLLTAFCYSENLAKFHTFTPVVARVLSERPVACPLARMQSFTDRPLTSRFHENINTDPMTRQLVRVLDGTRDRAALVREIEQTLEMRPIEFDLDEQADLASAVDRCLRELLWSGMLIA
jgi:hypothetical protein